jgi:primosomal protein N' (replication factor Y)
MIQCPECQSQQLKPVGEGTEKIESFLQSVFPDANILRFDQSINQGKGNLEKALTAIDQKRIDIIVGTQMVSKGHHFPYLTFVGVINIDSAFHSGDFRAVERMGQQLTQVTGRAGRENTQGEVMIQTAYPEQPLLNTLLKQGYLYFAEKLIEERQMLDLPPITHMALLRVESTNRAKSHHLVEKVKMYVINVFGLEVSHAIFVCFSDQHVSWFACRCGARNNAWSVYCAIGIKP